MRKLSREERAIYDAERFAIGRNVKRLRETLGLRQADLAASLGTSQQNIARCELGVQALPHYRLIQVAMALGLKSTLPLRIDHEAGNSPVPAADKKSPLRKRVPKRAKIQAK